MFYAAASQFTNIIVDTTSGRIMIILPLLGPFLGPLLAHCRVAPAHQDTSDPRGVVTLQKYEFSSSVFSVDPVSAVQRLVTMRLLLPVTVSTFSTLPLLSSSLLRAASFTRVVTTLAPDWLHSLGNKNHQLSTFILYLSPYSVLINGMSRYGMY